MVGTAGPRHYFDPMEHCRSHRTPFTYARSGPVDSMWSDLAATPAQMQGSELNCAWREMNLMNWPSGVERRVSLLKGFNLLARQTRKTTDRCYYLAKVLVTAQILAASRMKKRHARLLAAENTQVDAFIDALMKG